MVLTIKSETPALRIDESGAIRVGNTRVLFVLVIREYQKGATPEEIARAFDTLDLADVYSAITYYLRHRTEVEKYLEDYDRQAEQIRLKIEERQGSQVGIRERLLHRLSGQSGDQTNTNHTGAPPET